MLLVAVAVIYLLFARAEGRDFHLPGSDGAVVMAAGLWAALLLVFRLFDKPGCPAHGVAANVGMQWGIFFALAAAGLLAYAGSRMRAARPPEPPLARPPRAGASWSASRGARRAHASTPAARAACRTVAVRRHRAARRRGATRPRRPVPADHATEQLSFEDHADRARTNARPEAPAPEPLAQRQAPYHCADDASVPLRGARTLPGPDSVADVAAGLREVGYLPGESTALVAYLATKLGKPVLVEGPAGVGKTELAKALARVPRPRARAAAVLRGPRRGEGAVRVELPQAAAAHPGRGRRRRLGGGAGGHLRRGVPARAAADERDRLRAARSCC